MPGNNGYGIAWYRARVDSVASLAAAELARLADPRKAPAMASYMKTDMPFYGVQKKERVEVLRIIRGRFPVVDNEAYRTQITALWGRPHREEKYLAISIAKSNRRFISSDNLDLYRRIIVEGAWWDFVDDVAANCVGLVHRNERAVMEPIIEAWVDDEFMWLRRTALLSPLKHKADTDYETLFDHCLRRADETEFFIRKAIGWVLREYAKTEPDRVRDFLRLHRDRWSGLTLREASKHIGI